MPEGRLAYFEWSVDEDAYRAGIVVGDEPEQWAVANPAMGTRISEEFIRAEMGALGGPRSPEFARERLGIGTWPPEDESQRWEIVPRAAWTVLYDPLSRVTDPVMFAIDVTPMRDHAAIAVAGPREDGLAHVEVVDHRPGVDWVVPRITALITKWSPLGVVVDIRSPAGSLHTQIENVGAPLLPFDTRDLADSFALFVDAVAAQTVRHLAQPSLDKALAGATRRPLGGGAWALGRWGVPVDICPLVAAAEALWAYLSAPAPSFHP